MCRDPLKSVGRGEGGQSFQIFEKKHQKSEAKCPQEQYILSLDSYMNPLLHVMVFLDFAQMSLDYFFDRGSLPQARNYIFGAECKSICQECFQQSRTKVRGFKIGREFCNILDICMIWGSCEKCANVTNNCMSDIYG